MDCLRICKDFLMIFLVLFDFLVVNVMEIILMVDFLFILIWMVVVFGVIWGLNIVWKMMMMKFVLSW